MKGLILLQRELEKMKAEEKRAREEARKERAAEQRAKAKWQRYVQSLPENNIRQIESNAIYEAYAEYCESTRW